PTDDLLQLAAIADSVGVAGLTNRGEVRQLLNGEVAEVVDAVGPLARIGGLQTAVDLDPGGVLREPVPAGIVCLTNAIAPVGSNVVPIERLHEELAVVLVEVQRPVVDD